MERKQESIIGFKHYKTEHSEPWVFYQLLTDNMQREETRQDVLSSCYSAVRDLPSKWA